MPSRRERLLTLFFAALFVFGVAHLLLDFLSIPAYYQRVTTLSIEPFAVSFPNNPTNASVQQGAAERGMTLSQYAIEQTLFSGAIVLLCMAVALLIVWRARWNWFAWYSAFFLTFIAGFAFFDQIYVARLLPLWFLEIGSLFWPLILVYFFLFPNGKPVPRWAMWVVAPMAVVHFALQLLGFVVILFEDAKAASSFQFLVPNFEIVIGAEFVFIFLCQVYRYLRVSTWVEKQQTKWFLVGFIFFLGLSTLSDSMGTANPYRDEVGLLIFAFVPLSVGVAILRYRLWDLDILIRRTVTYSLLTALLLAVFFGSVIVLQQAFASVTGSAQNELVTVLSTLMIAALFVPLRQRIQQVIDRRFNRRKYDAQQVLSQFAATARDETDLGKLTNRLIEVVDETMQPNSVSVSLKAVSAVRKREFE